MQRIWTTFTEVDGDNDGKISLPEFKWCVTLAGCLLHGDTAHEDASCSGYSSLMSCLLRYNFLFTATFV